MQGLEKSDILHKLYQTTYNKGKLEYFPVKIKMTDVTSFKKISRLWGKDLLPFIKDCLFIGANLLRTIDNNPELDKTVKRTSDSLTDTVHTIANEPSLAFFRIEEHVRRSVPLLVHHKVNYFIEKI